MAVRQITRILNRRGLQADLPEKLGSAEFGYSIDTRRLFIGNGDYEEGAPIEGNTEILTEYSDISSKLLAADPTSVVIRNNQKNATIISLDTNEFNSAFMRYTIMRGTARAVSTALVNMNTYIIDNGSEMTITLRNAAGAATPHKITFGNANDFSNTGITATDAIPIIAAALGSDAKVRKVPNQNSIEIVSRTPPISMSPDIFYVASHKDFDPNVDIPNITYKSNVIIDGKIIGISNPLTRMVNSMNTSVAGQTTLTLDTASNIAAGDFIGVRNTSFIGTREDPIYRVQVDSVSGNNVVISAPVFNTASVGINVWAASQDASHHNNTTITTIIAELRRYIDNGTPGKPVIRGLKQVDTITGQVAGNVRLRMKFDDTTPVMTYEETDTDLGIESKEYSSPVYALGFTPSNYGGATEIGAFIVQGDNVGKIANWAVNSTTENDIGVSLFASYSPDGSTLQINYNSTDFVDYDGHGLNGVIYYEVRRWRSDTL